jgi:hypothetical protein
VPYYDWMEHEPKFVDEIILHQRLDECSTAGKPDVPTRLLLQLADLLGDIPFDER